MRQGFLAIGVAAFCSAGILAADNNVRVRITGCVMDGNDGSFVLTNVQELSGGKMSPTSSVYWLSSTKGLKQQVGHKVEVTGTIEESSSAGSSSAAGSATSTAAMSSPRLKVDSVKMVSSTCP